MKYSKSNNQFKRLEWCFGKFIYRPCYPFRKNISAFAINEKGIGAFLHFLSFIKNSTWRMLNWDCWKNNAEDFHAELYGWIESLPPQIQGNLKLCVIVNTVLTVANLLYIILYIIIQWIIYIQYNFSAHMSVYLTSLFSSPLVDGIILRT